MPRVPACVLAVDDDEDFRALLHLAWRKLGTTGVLVTVAGGAEARAWLGAGGAPAVITVDLQLDGESGLALLASLGSTPATVHLPRIVLSSASRPPDVAAAYAAGAYGFIRKPSGVDAMARVLGAVNEFWLGINVPAAPHVPAPPVEGLRGVR